MSLIKGAIKGTAEKPRLCVSITNRNAIAQIIDDDKGHTLAYSTSLTGKPDGSLSEKAAWVGEDIAKKAKKAKVKQVVFDRNRRRYHGRVKTLADAARSNGLEF